MAFLTALTPITPVDGEHRYSFAQINDVVVCCNGHDNNSCIYTRTGTGNDLGIATPGAAPTDTIGAAGNVTGTVRYRVRWYDSLRGNTMSLPSAELTVTTTNTIVNIIQPASPPSRATHWIIERTINLGKVFYPVNQTPTSPFGSPIATTPVADNLTDALLSGQNNSIASVQGKPKPFLFAFPNLQRIFMGGGSVHSVPALVTNGSVNVSGGERFNANLVDRFLSVPADQDGKMYQVATVPNSGFLTLTTNYTGTTGTKTVLIAGRRDVGCWSQATQPEAYGTAVISPISGISNEVQLGDDGQPLSGGVGLGVNGVLWCKETKCYAHTYTYNPDGLTGDGRIIELPVRRGATGPLAVRFIDGYVYGIDVYGVWRMAPGGLPEPIDTDISNDIRAMQWNYNYGDTWHIGHHPVDKTIHFFVTVGTSDTLPRTSYVWSIEKEKWVDTVLWPVGISRTATLPDQFSIHRMNIITRHTSTAGAFMWAYGIGTTFGANPTTTLPTTGTATSGTTGTIVASGASWTTTDGGLIGCAVIRERLGVQEERVIIANTATSITVHLAFSDATTADDTYKIAPIKAVWRTGRISLGTPERKMRSVELWLWLRYQGSCTQPKVRFYYDGNYIQMNDVSYSYAQDGVTWDSNLKAFILDPTVANMHFFKIPLGGWEHDVQVEVYSDDAGEPWSILGARLVGQVDDDWNPAVK